MAAGVGGPADWEGARWTATSQLPRLLAKRVRYRERRAEARREAVMSSGGGSALEDPKV